MKYFSLAALCCAIGGMANAAQAEQCDANAEVLKADYLQQQGKQNAKGFSLWRLHQEVAHQALAQGLVEKWQHLRSGQVRPVRYFEQYQRGIEYQPGELKGQGLEIDWSQKYQLVSNALLEQPVRTQGQGCEREELFEHGNEQQKLAITWLPELKLVKSMTLSKQDDQGQWQQVNSLELQGYQLNKQQVERQFALWDSYQSTDYADVGDNEQDPFLAKMINQGFIEHGASGFYSSDGQALRGGHHH
ncbi:hypothetical protein [Pseudoalteromonas sp. BDTF-M6]|uniref:hypothetical protein n=1 Tax=Pseudoalteromonas sp. BDTF-M6 TaxID=2796132 RepID=UPI00201641BD|nr:hypothetical protein [Pseudoalteromonas sp. BDTF-M6]